MRIFEATIDPRSLRWDGGELVDAAGGFRRWTADGKELAGTWNTAYRFDRAAHSPTGRVARGVGAAPGRAFGVEHIPSRSRPCTPTGVVSQSPSGTGSRSSTSRIPRMAACRCRTPS
ncbi:hypothetical protein [Streptomyces sp. NBC_01443]|uniref:hypothetical protein n=1 Tax=Streptomyces sp. NBC_01443 TaxID=2903868 RepID=UPI002250739E|nr:hypothetical protein [Streptomyces sp. NBC_01443]MCX4627433.1 hypothetical protein [Streptomyces sp. NBC_01443]